MLNSRVRERLTPGGKDHSGVKELMSSLFCSWLWPRQCGTSIDSPKSISTAVTQSRNMMFVLVMQKGRHGVDGR